MDYKSKYLIHCAQSKITPRNITVESLPCEKPLFVAKSDISGNSISSKPCSNKKSAQQEIYAMLCKEIPDTVPSKFNVNNLVDSLNEIEEYSETYTKSIDGVTCSIRYKELSFTQVGPSRALARSKCLALIPQESIRFN